MRPAEQIVEALLEDLRSKMPHLAAQFPQFSEQDIEKIAEFDPTNSKGYTAWLLKQVRGGRLDLEASGKEVSGALSLFDRYKSRKEWTGPRDINQVQGPDQLYAALSSFTGDSSPKNGPTGAHLTLRKITSEQELMAISGKTAWCTKKPEDARKYLSQGALYLVFKDARPYVLVHPGTSQARDIHDVTISDQIADEITPTLGKIPRQEWDKNPLFLGNDRASVGHPIARLYRNLNLLLPQNESLVEALLEASAPEWVQQRMSARVAAGWNPRWPFVPVDLYNPGFREAIQSDPELSDAEKQQILSFAPGGKNERSLFGESIAVDLDGTLARDNGWKGPEHIGKPIKPMLDLVQNLLDDGEEVVIFTARCHDGKSSTKDYVKQWLKDNGLPDLEVTNEKRPDMEKFYDDKAIEVVTNKGIAETLLEASSHEDFERGDAIERGELAHPGYKDGWQPITPEIADFVGHDFRTCCEGSYRGPDKGFVYGENGKPRLIALVRRGRVDFVAGWRAPRGQRQATPEEKAMAQQLVSPA